MTYTNSPMKTAKIILTLIVCCMSAFTATAQKEDHAAWLKEVDKYKHEYMAKELNLAKDQQTRFFQVYDAMSKELRDISRQTRKMMKDVAAKGEKATDLELEKAAQASFELKGKEAAIEMKYYPRLKEVLTPQQLFKLKKVERHFTREMVQKHNKMKGKKGNAKK